MVDVDDDDDDDDGNKWGVEDSDWCGIDEIVHDSWVLIKNRNRKNSRIPYNLHMWVCMTMNS